jgi:hypothetical protein
MKKFTQNLLVIKCSASILLLVVGWFMTIQGEEVALAQGSDKLTIRITKGNVSYRKKGEKDKEECRHKANLSESFSPENEPISLCIYKNSKVDVICPTAANGDPGAERSFTGPRDNKPYKNQLIPNCVRGRVNGPGDILPGGSRPDIPYIISPRYTRLQTLRPTFRWNTLQNERYTVQLYQIIGGRRDSSPIWEKKNVTTSHIAYPNDQLPLSSDYAYEFTVTVEGGGKSSEGELSKTKLDDYRSSNRGGVSGLRFRPLSSEENSIVNENIEGITGKNSLPSPEEIKELPSEQVLKLKVLYADQNNLYAEAIELLEIYVGDVAVKTSIAPDVYLTLGNLYKDVGLNCLAIKYYDYIPKDSRSKESSDAILRTIDRSMCQ